MTWEFAEFVLDKERAELRGGEDIVAIERLPLEALIYLIEHRERVVGRDELVEAVWAGRVVSDATVATAIKQARKALGDGGREQRFIKTVHGRGFRFVGDIKDRVPRVPIRAVFAEPSSQPGAPVGAGRPSLAVLRFHLISAESAASMLAEAFPAELIANLSRVRWLDVIARGSSFRFDPKSFEPGDVGERLGVRYLVSGTIEISGDDIAISTEIMASTDGALVWSDRFTAATSEIHRARRDIAAAIVTALEISIPEFEAANSRRLDDAEFDAWSHFHLGLSHIYKFNQGDNLIAAQHFNAALTLDPAFARAHAGLSFTHWQNAFMQFGADRGELLARAVSAAERALELDANDPFASFNMGRARWLEGDIQASQSWLDRALQINPNYAQCYYNKGLILTLDGAAEAAQSAALKAMSLSPLDPLYYGMLGVRAMSHMATEEFAEASRLAEAAMQSPGAHFYIALIAASANELKGDQAKARHWFAHALKMRPNANRAMFLAAFPFRDPDMRARISGALGRLGLP